MCASIFPARYESSVHELPGLFGPLSAARRCRHGRVPRCRLLSCARYPRLAGNTRRRVSLTRQDGDRRRSPHSRGVRRRQRGSLGAFARPRSPAAQFRGPGSWRAGRGPRGRPAIGVALELRRARAAAIGVPRVGDGISHGVLQRARSDRWRARLHHRSHAARASIDDFRRRARAPDLAPPDAADRRLLCPTRSRARNSRPAP